MLPTPEYIAHVESILILRVIAILAVPTDKVPAVLSGSNLSMEPLNTSSTAVFHSVDYINTASIAVSAVQNHLSRYVSLSTEKLHRKIEKTSLETIQATRMIIIRSDPIIYSKTIILEFPSINRYSWYPDVYSSVPGRHGTCSHQLRVIRSVGYRIESVTPICIVERVLPCIPVRFHSDSE